MKRKAVRSDEPKATEFSIESALESSPQGFIINIPAGTYVAPPGGWLITKSVSIVGETTQRAGIEPAVVLRSHAEGEPVFVIATGVTNVVIENNAIVDHWADESRGA